MNILSPSLLSIDFNHMEQDMKTLEEAGVKWFHLDVMDGYFVQNISFGPPVIQSIRKTSDAFFDVHLMVHEPIRYIAAFKSAGADMLTVHSEACGNLSETIEAVKAADMKVGVAINPDTPVDEISEYIDRVDMVLVMSVVPGFGGQKFMPVSLDKLRKVRSLADEKHKELLIQVDGGINTDNVKDVLEAGANVIVAGSAVFNGNKTENAKKFLELLNRDM